MRSPEGESRREWAGDRSGREQRELQRRDRAGEGDEERRGNGGSRGGEGEGQWEERKEVEETWK